MISAGRRTALRVGIALAVAALSLFFAFRQVDLSGVIAAIRTADPWWIAATVAGMLLAHFSRAMRWRAMLRSLKTVRVGPAFSAVMIAYGINQVLPRGGELARPWLLGRREHLSASMLLATVVVERVIDVISLIAALLVSIWLSSGHVGEAIATIAREHVGFRTVASFNDILLRITLPTAAALALLVWLFFTHRGLASLEWLARRAPARFHDRIAAMFARFRDGLRVVRSSGQVTMIVVWTVGVWLGYGLMTWFPLYALHLEHYGMSFGDAFALMSIITVGRTIAPTPGAIGIYHVFCIQAMILLYGVSAGDAAAFATLSHGVLYLAMIIIGAAAWMIEESRRVR